MRNNGLFSTLFIDRVKTEVGLDDMAKGRMVSLRYNWESRDSASSVSLWDSFMKQALGNLDFIPGNRLGQEGIYPLHEDYSFQNSLSFIYLIEPDAELDDIKVGRFWPSKLLAVLKKNKLNWGILTDGAIWRLYSLKTAKPYEDYVELDLAAALENDDETEYALFERFFHAESFAPEEVQGSGFRGSGFRGSGFRGSGFRGSDVKGVETGNQQEVDETKAAKEVGIYRCRLDQDGDESEKILQDKVKTPLLVQVDEVLQYVCNGFIADTRKSGDDYTEEERRDIFESAVKLLYRCLFLFYAESRKLLPSEKSKEREYYGKLSIQHICEEARKFKWQERTDTEAYTLWNHLKGLVNAVNEGDPAYGVMGYNGGLFDDDKEIFLGQHKLRNDYLARALYLMAYVEPRGKLTKEDEYRIPFEDLEVRHLGELYENILEFNVKLADTDSIRRRTKDGFVIKLASETTLQSGDTEIKQGQVYFGQSANERKQSGSYYTPESLVGFLVEKSVVNPLRETFEEKYSARLDEFLDEAESGADSIVRRGAVTEAERLITRFIEGELLKFKVCDPAMGSGHFLVSAANRMTGLIIELFAKLPVQAGEYSQQTCQPNYWRRLVTRHCIYGVDLNSLAVNLGKLSLWLNCFATDHKLTFLDHRLKSGNSLIGIRTLDCLKSVPKRKKDPKKKKDIGPQLPHLDTFESEFEETAKKVANLAAIDEDDTDRQKAEYDTAMEDALDHLTPLADLYTAYLMDKDIATDAYRRVFQKTATGEATSFFDEDLATAAEKVCELSKRHRFFHWAIEFPDVFESANSAGFSATIGNPPWDIVKPNSQEFFSLYDPDFRKYKKQEAKKKSAQLMEGNSAIRWEWDDYGANFAEQSSYFKELSTYPALGGGDINTFKLFLEQFFELLKEGGHEGIVTPSGLYTDKGCQPLRKMFFDNSNIDFLYCFENRWPTVFLAVDGRFKFILFSTVKGGATDSFKCAFMEHDPERLPLIDKNALEMTVEQVRKFSPDTLSVMEFKNQQDIDITNRIYGEWPLLGEKLDDVWNVKFKTEIHMTNDSHLLNESEDGFPLYEGKMIHQYDPFYGNARWCVTAKIKDMASFSTKLYTKARLGFRGVAASTNERTLISVIVPPNVIGECLLPLIDWVTQPISLVHQLFLEGIFNSFVVDFVIRQKVSSRISNFYLLQLPIPRDIDQVIIDSVSTRALRLNCVSDIFIELWKDAFLSTNSLTALYSQYGPIDEQIIRERLAKEAKTLSTEWTPACGVHDRTADRRDDGDRAQLRAEIDAYVAHLYGLSRDDFEYILDTFPVLRRKEEKAFGEFKSKRKCLEEYDRIEGEV